MITSSGTRATVADDAAGAAHARLDAVLARAARDRELTGIVARVERPADGFAWAGATGEATTDRPVYIASATKLYTTAIVLRLAERGILALDDRLVERVPADLVRGLHVRDGVDRTHEITLRHLLAHTSGLPDYFQGSQPGVPSLERRLLAGDDRGWTLDDVLEIARRQGPRFVPGARRAQYSDTNFQLLGRVVEEAAGRRFDEVLRAEVLEPLGTGSTWMVRDPADDRPLPLRYRRDVLPVPHAMASFGPDGGIAAPVDELMRFLRGFHEGALFDPAVLPSLAEYRRVFFPVEAGVGYLRLRLPRLLSPFAAQPELVGHSGLSGAFAFLAPARGVYLAGTVNNIATPSRSFRLMFALLRALDAGPGGARPSG
ncbi:MAG TPA: serine hydrolase domain-containing protein [Candidatus Limnocylindrales bacterium]|nr:serine hydrolase domain-containing protein [Candidatus Limnocylindrales bacterium]